MQVPRPRRVRRNAVLIWNVYDLVLATMDKKEKVLDKEAIRLMLQALTPEELRLARERYIKENKGGKRRKISLQHID